MQSGQHTQFQIDNVNYYVSSTCEQAIWPRLVDRVVRHIERVGKHAAKDMFGHTASAEGRTKINNNLVKFVVTINPKGLPLVN